MLPFTNDNLDDNRQASNNDFDPSLLRFVVSIEVVAMPSASASNTKPSKPYPTFPLTAHPNGQWCKKIRGRVHFFGVWADPKSALDEYNRQAGDLHAGRKPVMRSSDKRTVKEVANAYLAAQKAKAERLLISPHWFDDCTRTLKDFASGVGKDRPWDDLRPSDFADYRMSLYDRYSTNTVDRYITVIRAAFKHGFDCDLMDRPVKFGGMFNKPTRKEQRVSRIEHERENGKRLFEPQQIHKLLDAARQPLKAMILLGINGGFGNTDCAELPISAVDLKDGIIDYPRPKTAVQRVVPLWPETAKALREVIEKDRPRARRDESNRLVFLTVQGNPWRQSEMLAANDGDSPKIRRVDAISAEFGKLLDELKMKRGGLGFYALRHTFRTWADEVSDQHAIHLIMGHAIPGMSGFYVERIDHDRLRTVTNRVRRRLFNRR